MNNTERALLLLKQGAIDLDGAARMAADGPATTALHKGFLSSGFSAARSMGAKAFGAAGSALSSLGSAAANVMGRSKTGRAALATGRKASWLGRQAARGVGFTVKHGTGLGMLGAGIVGLGTGYMAYQQHQRQSAGVGIAGDRSYRRRYGGPANSSPF